ncbi:serine/threonine-protein kinase fhkB [Biomphalaria pfeifferi]|nr:serine/threonine-protein kinase fhkB [Biomphalaria pfeifferi]
MYLDLDTNLNGNIDRHEIDESFRTYDSNNNGRISRTEYTNFVTSHEPTLLDLSHALYDVYDVDSDDQLDHHDFDNFYSLMDGNADGVVSHFEFSRYWTILLTNLAHLHSQKKK